MWLIKTFVVSTPQILGFCETPRVSVRSSSARRSTPTGQDQRPVRVERRAEATKIMVRAVDADSVGGARQGTLHPPTALGLPCLLCALVSAFASAAKSGKWPCVSNSKQKRSLHPRASPTVRITQPSEL